MARQPVKKPAPKPVKAKVKAKPAAPVATAPAAPVAAKPSSISDKAFDLVKWVDSPFKLATVVVLGVLGLGGYIVYQQQDKLVGAITTRDTMPVLLADERLSSLARDLIRDTRAETIIIHEIDLAKNARTTRIAQSTEGRFPPLEGKKGAFFSGSPARNRAAVAMLNGEVLCEPFTASSDVGDWIVSRGVTYACRGSIPPEAGHMTGYLAVGFKQEPRDTTATKARINQTAREMAK
jgi:CBS domain-containing protein